MKPHRPNEFLHTPLGEVLVSLKNMRLDLEKDDMDGVKFVQVLKENIGFISKRIDHSSVHELNGLFEESTEHVKEITYLKNVINALDKEELYDSSLVHFMRNIDDYTSHVKANYRDREVVKKLKKAKNLPIIDYIEKVEFLKHMSYSHVFDLSEDMKDFVKHISEDHGHEEIGAYVYNVVHSFGNKKAIQSLLDYFTKTNTVIRTEQIEVNELKSVLHKRIARLDLEIRHESRQLLVEKEEQLSKILARSEKTLRRISNEI